MNAKECAYDNNMDDSSIRFHCNGKIANPENRRFMYLDDYNKIYN